MHRFVANLVCNWEQQFKVRTQISKGAFTYDVRFSGRQVGQAASDFTKKAYASD